MGFNNAHLIQRIGSWIKQSRTHNCIVSQVEFLMWAARSPVSTKLKPHSTKTIAFGFHLDVCRQDIKSTNIAFTHLNSWSCQFYGDLFLSHLIFSSQVYVGGLYLTLPRCWYEFRMWNSSFPVHKDWPAFEPKPLKKCRPGPPTVELGHKLLRIGDMKHFVGIFVPAPHFPLLHSWLNTGTHLHATFKRPKTPVW